MKTVLVFLAGVWLARSVLGTLELNRSRERQLNVRKALETLFQENLPNLSVEETQTQIKAILNLL